MFRENGWSLFGLVAEPRGARAARRSGRRGAPVQEGVGARRRRAHVVAGDEPETTIDHAADRRQRSSTSSRATASGLPVVLLHGYTDSWRSFEPLLPHLPASLRVFAVTQRGHGDAARPAKGYTSGDFASDVAAFLDAFQIPRAVIVGHSMGATVAQQFAVDRPERVLALVLEGAFLPKPGNAGVRELCGVDRQAHRSDRPGVRARVSGEHAREAGAGGAARDSRRREPQGAGPRLAGGARAVPRSWISLLNSRRSRCRRCWCGAIATPLCRRANGTR